MPLREDTNDAPRMQLVIVRYETLLMISHGFELLDVDAIAFLAALTIPRFSIFIHFVKFVKRMTLNSVLITKTFTYALLTVI